MVNEVYNVETNFIQDVEIPEELEKEVEFLKFFSRMYDISSEDLIKFIEENFVNFDDKILMIRITFKQITLYPRCRNKFVEFFWYFYSKYDFKLHHSFVIRSNPILFCLLYERGIYTIEEVKDCVQNNVIFYSPIKKRTYCYSFLYRFLFAPELGLEKEDCPSEYMMIYDAIKAGDYEYVYDIRRHGYASVTIEYYIKYDMIDSFLSLFLDIHDSKTVTFSRWDNINPEFYPKPIEMDMLSFATYYKAEKIVRYLLSRNFKLSLASYIYSIRSSFHEITGSYNPVTLMESDFNKSLMVTKKDFDPTTILMSESLTSCKDEVFDYLVCNFSAKKCSMLFPARSCNTRGIIHSFLTKAVDNNFSKDMLHDIDTEERLYLALNEIYCYNNNLNGVIFPVENGHLSILKYLFENGYSYKPNNELINPVGMAASVGFVDCIKILIQYGYSINELSSHKTPLIYASWHGNVAVLRFLLLNGCDVDFQDIFGFTPLHYACFFRHKEAVELLLQANANTNIKTKRINTTVGDVFDYSRSLSSDVSIFGKTAFELAQKFNYTEIMQLFENMMF